MPAACHLRPATCYSWFMAIEYHKHLDRILVRRAAETEALQRQVESNRPGGKFVLAFFCFGLAGIALAAMPMLFPLWILPALGGMVLIYNGISVWRQVRHAEKTLQDEGEEEEYRRYLLAKLGPKKFDQLATAVSSGGSDASIQGWLKPLGFDDHDIQYLLWITEALLDTLRGVPRELLKAGAAAREVRKAELASARAKREATGAAGPASREREPLSAIEEAQPPVVPVAELAEREASDPNFQSHPHVPPPDAAEKTPPQSALSEDEVAKFRALAAQRKAEYEKWRAAGGRESDPDDPFGKLKDFSPEKIAELKRKAQERRKQGAAPTSSAPAPGAHAHEGAFTPAELNKLEKKALSRFEPRPEASAKQEVLGGAFSAEELEKLKEKAERKQADKNTPARDDDPEWREGA